MKKYIVFSIFVITILIIAGYRDIKREVKQQKTEIELKFAIYKSGYYTGVIIGLERKFSNVPALDKQWEKDSILAIPLLK